MPSSTAVLASPPAASLIRGALRAIVAKDPNVVVVDELGICLGAARLDLAVVGGALRGYEIKSDRDSLRRLAGQAALYGRVVEEMVLITGPAHIEAATVVVPMWWGVELVRPDRGGLSFERVRDCQLNTALEAHSAVQLLWRDEALAACRTLGVDAGLTSKPRKMIWDRLVHEVGDVRQLLAIVREQLRARVTWPAREGTLANGFML